MKTNDRREKALSLIKQGYSAKEICEIVGWKETSSVYSLAKKHNLKVTKPTSKKVEAIKEMRSKGMTVTEIAENIGIFKSTVKQLCAKYDIPIIWQTEERTCERCGKQFVTENVSNKKYCSDECRRKSNRGENNIVDDSIAFELLSRCGSEWEYVDGYTGSDGYMNIRHKNCGTVVKKSCVTIRKGRALKCEHCAEMAREQKQHALQRQKEIEKDLKEFNRPVKKWTQVSPSICEVCGCLFIGNGKTCSNECRKDRLNHYYNMKKRVRTRKAWTAESKTIGLSRLYERDKGICWLCGGMCDYSADTNDNSYPSIDHVIPIAKGGMDKWDNIKLAHRGCNSYKGVKILEPDAVSISPRSEKK